MRISLAGLVRWRWVESVFNKNIYSEEKKTNNKYPYIPRTLALAQPQQQTSPKCLGLGSDVDEALLAAGHSEIDTDQPLIRRRWHFLWLWHKLLKLVKDKRQSGRPRTSLGWWCAISRPFHRYKKNIPAPSHQLSKKSNSAHHLPIISKPTRNSMSIQKSRKKELISVQTSSVEKRKIVSQQKRGKIKEIAYVYMVNWYKMSVHYSILYIHTSDIQKGQGYMNEGIVWRRKGKNEKGKWRKIC